MPAGVPAYVPLANITLSAPSTSVNFSNISQSHRDLVLVSTYVYPSSAVQNPRATINNDTASNYSLTYIDAYSTNGTAAGNDNGANFSLSFVSNNLTTNPAVSIANFFDYSATDKHKNIVIRYNIYGSGVGLYGARWASNSAMTSLQINSQNSISFQAGSTFALYGVSA